MKTIRRSNHLVPAVAVAAVTLAALAAAWTPSDTGESVAAARPALDAPVRIVRGPATETMQPMACRDCSQPAGPGGRY